MDEYITIRHRVSGDITSENYRESDDRIYEYAVRRSSILVARAPTTGGREGEHTVQLCTPVETLYAIGTQDEMVALYNGILHCPTTAPASRGTAIKWTDASQLPLEDRNLHGVAPGGAICEVMYDMNTDWRALPWKASIAGHDLRRHGYATQAVAKKAIEDFVDSVAGK